MTSLPPDPYKTLGVSKDAQITEIRSAHRKLVLKCHPDKVQDPALKALKQDEFQKVQQAYELLSDEKERQRYDDQARIAELRKQMQAKANTSSPRATPTTYKFDIRTAEPRPNSYKSTSGTPPGSKFYPRSYEDDRGPQIFDAEPRVRREQSYSDKPSKRESEREREREAIKEKERERQKKASDALRRAEKEAKEAKEARRAEKKKEREKERKREAVDKKQRDKPPYLEPFEDEVPVKEKKKSSKKHDEKRDRSSHREEAMPRMSAPPPPPMPDQPWASTLDSAVSYIEAKNRSKAYHPTRVQPPAAPTPPPAPGQSSPFSPPPDDDVRRSAAKSRRGSSGEKKAYKKASHEVLEDPDIVDTSPSAHYAQKSATAAAALSGSPPRRELHRQHTMPISAERFSRPIPNMSRSQTYTAGSYPEMADPRGRGRSKLQPQIEESDSEDEHAQRRRERRERKHSSKKHHSPEPHAAEYVQQYKVEGGRTVPQNSYTRNMDPAIADGYAYYPSHTRGIQVQETRPSMSARDASYSSSPGNYTGSFGTKVKTSKAYDFEDVAYSNTYAMYHEDYAQAY